MKSAVGEDNVLEIYISGGNEDIKVYDEQLQVNVDTTSLTPEEWQYKSIRDAFKKLNNDIGLSIKEVSDVESADANIFIHSLSDGYSVSLHEEFIGHFGNSYFGELSEYYYGEYDNTKEFAENFVEENYDLDSIPDIIRSNIDYENVWYDLQHDFVEIEADRSTYFFRQ